MANIDWPAALLQHDRWLRTVVLARLGQACGVDEVLQEVALATVKQQANLDDPTKAAPWLYRLAVRHALLQRRSLGRRRKLIARFAERFRPVERDSRVLDPLDWLLADERRMLVRQALERLPGRDAELLLLKYTQDWSYVDLAAHLGATTAAIEARLHRARARLRAALATTEAPDPDAAADRKTLPTSIPASISVQP